MLNSEYAPYTQLTQLTGRNARERALEHFREARLQSRVHRFFSRLAGRPNELNELRAQKTAGQRHHAGLRTVRIEHITGSENRSRDFDRAFNPLGERTRDRWLSVMEARLKHVALPPVELINVSGAYFVRDGHHRISVAKALGETFVEAGVTEE